MRKASRGHRRTTVEVHDDGPGFPDDFLAHAFERFRRPDAARSRDDGAGTGTGTGLRLAIVQAICAAHGGRRPHATALAAVPRSRSGCQARSRRQGLRVLAPGQECDMD
jgi:K+-sensing histidine kinase KdpD